MHNLRMFHMNNNCGSNMHLCYRVLTLPLQLSYQCSKMRKAVFFKTAVGFELEMANLK